MATDRSDTPYHSPQPAVWVDMGDLLATDPHVDAALQDEAERLLETVASTSGEGDPSLAAHARQEAIARSDQWFRARYGGWLWMQHHLQSHHLAAGRAETKP